MSRRASSPRWASALAERRQLPLAALLGLVLTALAVAWRTSPPEPRAASAPPDVFSAERGLEALRRVLPESSPHPVGSEEQRRTRARLEALLAELGWSARVATAPSCSHHGACAVVENVIAERPAPPGPRLVLLAHYDSVPAGPGASDDGLGVATLLEVARALRHRATLLPVMLVFTDGEEAGLLGAEAFVEHELAKQPIAAVVNVEARGVSGPALLFQTSGPNDWLVAAFARAAERPITSSLFPAVYARLPNDTDLTVFARAGVPGMNFANIGGVGRYHTPEDDFRHFSKATLQHHGDTTLALTAELGARPQGARPALFFDVLGFGVVRLPLALSPWLFALAVLVWAAAVARHSKKGARASQILRALGLCPLLVALVALAAFGAGALFRATGALGDGFPAHATAFFVFLAALLVALASLFASFELRALWLGAWSFHALAGLVPLLFLPEASFLFSVPLLVAGIVGLMDTRERPHVAAMLPALASLVLWLPVLRLAYDALGLGAPALLAACSALAFGGLWPALSELAVRPRQRLAAVAGGIALVALGSALVLPGFSASKPLRSSLALHVDADSGRCRYLVDASSDFVPDALVAAGGFGAERVDSAPSFVGWHALARQGEAPRSDLPAPVWERRGSKLWLASRRGARVLRLHFASDASAPSMTFEGRPVSLRPGPAFRSLTLFGVGPEGVELELGPAAGARFMLSDHSFDLPASAAPLLAARPKWALPSQAGDETVVSRKVAF